MSVIRRKVQKTGTATFTVSLPKSWVVKNSVKSGDIITLYEEEDQTLKISLDSSTKKPKERSIVLENFENEDDIIRKFTAYYLKGYSKIKLMSKDKIYPKARKLVRKIQKIIGFEIIDEDTNYVLFQDFFTSHNLSIQKAIRRQFNLSKLIVKEILDKSPEEVDQENLMHWEEDVNKLCLLIRRQINFALHNSAVLRQLEITIEECQEYLLLSNTIEKLTDEFVRVAKNQLKIKNPEMLLETYEEAYKAVVNRDFKKSSDIIDQIIDMRKDKDSRVPVLHFIKAIAEIGLDRI